MNTEVMCLYCIDYYAGQPNTEAMILTSPIEGECDDCGDIGPVQAVEFLDTDCDS